MYAYTIYSPAMKHLDKIRKKKFEYYKIVNFTASFAKVYATANFSKSMTFFTSFCY